MFEVAGGVRCRVDVAQRRGYSDRSNAATFDFAPGTADWRLQDWHSTPRAIVMLYVIHV